MGTGEEETKLQSKSLRTWGYYILGFLPFLGKILRRLLGHANYRHHFRRLWTSPSYFLRAGRGRIAESLIRWLRAGCISSAMPATIRPRMATDIRATSQYMGNSWVVLTLRGLNFDADPAVGSQADL